ncbi:MAG: sulfite exporter TauE/SafE family protein [Acidobacteriota bacterium]|nr:MAG: sulfite exporter TauE/SafE family protein [Acidobacteriota bacterium]
MFQEFVEPGIPLVIFWIFVGLGIVVQGIGKSGFAGGVGILTIPLMMLVMPVDKVVASLLPLLILLDFNALYHHRHNKVWARILEIYLPSIVGILAGALLWWYIGQEGVEQYSVEIKRFVGVIAIIFAAYILAKERAMAWIDRLHPGPRSAWVFGITAGLTSTIAHAAGPIVSLYMFAQGMGKSLFVGTTAWTFTFINLTKLPFYLGIGLIRTDVLLFDLSLIWLIPLGSYLGKWMHDRIPEKPFNRVIMVFVFLAGVQLISNINLILVVLEKLLKPLLR